MGNPTIRCPLLMTDHSLPFDCAASLTLVFEADVLAVQIDISTSPLQNIGDAWHVNR
jgi:hypothetical protein